MSDRISYETLSMELTSILSKKKTGLLIIPDHQREYCWSKAKQEKFIDSIHEGLPCPSILIGHLSGTFKQSLEDGNQRLTTAEKFINNEIRSGPGSGYRLFREFTDIEQFMFKKYHIPVVTYSNATEEQRIRIFDWHQNGAPLTAGERFHAHGATPLVSFVKKTLMTSGEGLHDRAAVFWGVRSGKDDRRKALKNAVAFVVGIAFGSPYISQHYEKIISAPMNDGELHNLLLEAFDAERVTTDLEKVLSIYEEVEKRAPDGSNKIWKNKLWDGGFATCHIIHAMQQGLPWDRVFETWATFLTNCKKHPGYYEAFVSDVKTKDRNWKPERWEKMFEKMFTGGIVATSSSSNSATDSDEETEEEYDESDEEC